MRRQKTVEHLFERAGLRFPPAQLLLRGFKREKHLEVWTASRRDGPLVHVTTFEFCYASGKLGPKRREGDQQVPEGFYRLNYYNPLSRFHLSMQVSYPNLSDRILGDRLHPGGEIMIHGDCVSIGCISLSDERIEELWVMTDSLRKTGGRVYVHLLPTRDMAGLIDATEDASRRTFWRNLEEGFIAFERTKKIPKVRIDRKGRYSFH